MSNYEPQTEIVLCNHVPWDRSYEKTVLFMDKQEQQAFFRAREILTVPQNTYQRNTKNSFRVKAKVDELLEKGVNYCFWCNKEYSSKYYYAFVTSMEYVNPNVAIIYYELDLLQTYMFDINYHNSYIERRHYELGTRTSEGQMLIMPSDIPLVSEGLDYGNMYNVIKRVMYEQITNVSFAIIGTTSNYGTNIVYSIPTGIRYLVVPVYLDDDAYNVTFTYNGTTLSTIESVIDEFRNNSELVGTMVSITLIPFYPLRNISGTFNTSTKIYALSGNGLQITGLAGSLTCLKPSTFIGIQPYDFVSKIGTPLFELPNYSEPKLFMSPYSLFVMSTDRGDEFIIKPEYLSSGINIRLYGTIGPQNKQAFLINYYNGSGETYYLENGIVDESNANMPIIDDYSASYIQGNANAIQVARANAGRTRSTAIQQANNTYNTNAQQIDIYKEQQNKTYQNSLINDAISTVEGLALTGIQALSGNSLINPVAGIGQATQTAITTASNSIQTLNTANANYQNALLGATSEMLGAVNVRKNAMLSATTDYQNTIATLNAKYQDAENIADTVRNLGNDYIFNALSVHDGIYVYVKRIKDEYVIRLTNYFRMYGYLSNEMGDVNDAMTSREEYNYLKLIQVNCEGDLPQDNLMAIKDILMKGVTFFHKLTQNSGQETDYSCSYTNIAITFDDCLYPSETNIKHKTSHVINVGGGTTLDHVKYYDYGYFGVTTGGTLTFRAGVDDESKYRIKGWLSSRLGCFYEGSEVTIKVYYDDTFIPILEEI